MHFLSRIDVYMPSDIVDLAPSAWERLKALWIAPDTPAEPNAKNRREAATFVFEFRRVLDALGIDNARSLLADGNTIFQDVRNTSGDVPDMVLALGDHASLFGADISELRLCVDHEEAGIALSLEASITALHPLKAPAARIVVQGRIRDLEVGRGESTEEYRQRVNDLVSDPKQTKGLRLQFVSFVARLESELSRSFPDTRFSVHTEARDLAQLVDDWPLSPPSDRPGPAGATAVPQVNFTVNVEQRISALVSGPPAYAVRLKSIEDEQDKLVRELRESFREGRQDVPLHMVRRLEQLNKLIAEHNRYYPTEANLPVDIATGELMLLGKPWRPLRSIGIDDLRRRAATLL
ncbi:MAG: hypothetical protein KBF88_16860 [Polyangiaceae bacterium]|nr:hypothetical protein [Polyangiaceae bacterium]